MNKTEKPVAAANSGTNGNHTKRNASSVPQPLYDISDRNC